MWIKICGILSTETALCCAEAGADAIGFVFAESSRKIPVKAAGEIIKELPGGIQKVGVFVDRPYPEVVAIDELLGLDLLQFHGKESPQYCSHFPGRAVKSIPVGAPADLKAIEAYRGRVRACLLDSFQTGRAGGTGKTWNWNSFTGEVKQISTGIPLIVAGGLTAENVTDVMKTIEPCGVDTSSGVEREGHKDPALIGKFVRTVRRWEDEQLAR